jgi:hypothetical protein
VGEKGWVGGGPLLSLNSDGDGRESLRWFVYVGLQIWVMRRVWDLGGVTDDCCSVLNRGSAALLIW